MRSIFDGIHSNHRIVRARQKPDGWKPPLGRESQRNGWELVLPFIHGKYPVIMKNNWILEIASNIHLKKICAQSSTHGLSTLIFRRRLSAFTMRHRSSQM